MRLAGLNNKLKDTFSQLFGSVKISLLGYYGANISQ